MVRHGVRFVKKIQLAIILRISRTEPVDPSTWPRVDAEQCRSIEGSAPSAGWAVSLSSVR
jgi:hypothetical protein